MKMFYTRLTRGDETVNLIGEATMPNMLAAAEHFRELVADGWKPVDPETLAAEVQIATIPTPGYQPAFQ